jgi:biopolymer transport protein ExbB
MTLFFQSFLHGDFVIFSVFFLLTLMSFFSWYLIYQKSIKLKQEFRFYKKFHEEKKNVSSIDEINQNFLAGYVASIIAEKKILESSHFSANEQKIKDFFDLKFSQKLDEIKASLESGLTFLASIASCTPFIGLFGTVWGIYHSLQEISLQGSANLAVVAAPVGEALIATAFGLFVAIPATLAYNTFLRFNRLLLQNLRHLIEEIIFYQNH